MKVYDVFISYRRSDGTELAVQIYEYLTAKGLRVFLDREKMEDGHYFDTQIVKHLEQCPNYILIATPDVFQFRAKEDWVLEEIDLAVDTYEKDPDNHSINVIVPSGFDMPNTLPERISNISKPNRIYLADRLASEEEQNRLLKGVTHANRHNLWNAGHKWLEKAGKIGSKFYNLSIVDALLPEARYAAGKSRESLPIFVSEYKEDPMPLIHKISSTEGHLLLVGQGGIGKTTSLVKVMEDAYKNREYSNNTKIPLLVELASAPDVYGAYYKNGKSTFIRRSIFHQLNSQRRMKGSARYAGEPMDDAFYMDTETAVYPINDLFGKQTDTPEYILMLDGLNEVSRIVIDEVGIPVIQLIFDELQWLMTQCPNVRVIVTSRTSDFPLSTPVTVLELSGIEDQAIREYLAAKGKTEEEINYAAGFESLWEILRIPLFLVMYAELENTLNISTRGEILHLFFNQRSEHAVVYTQQNHLESVEEHMKRHSDAAVPLRLDALTQIFMLDFLVPELASHMVRKDKFYLDLEDIGCLLRKALTSTDVTSPFGIYGRKLFRKFRSQTNIRHNTYFYAQKLLGMANHDSDELASQFLDCSVYCLAILHERNGQFGFVHHHIRDYFAAQKYINCLLLAQSVREADRDVALQCLESMNDAVLTDNILFYIGEILGEHRNEPAYDGGWKYQVPPEPCARNLLERSLDICRDKFDGYALLVKNLVSAIELSRYDLAGINLSYLDLTACDLSYTNMGHLDLVANLEGTKVSGATVLSYGQEGRPTDACYSPDGRYIVTAMRDGTAKFWDKTTLKGEKMIAVDASVSNITFSPDDKTLVLARNDKKITLWNWREDKEINTFSCDQTEVISACYSFDGKHFAMATQDGRVTIWETVKNAVPYSEKLDWCTTVHYGIRYNQEHVLTHGKLSSPFCRSVAVFHPLRDQLAVAAKHTVVLWDDQYSRKTEIIPVHAGEVGAVAYHPSGKYIAFGVGAYIEIWDVDLMRHVGTLEGHSKLINSIQHSKDGNYLLSTSRDETVCLWNVRERSCQFKWSHPRYALTAFFSPDDDKIVIAWETDPVFEIFNIFSGTYERGIYGRPNWGKAARYIGNGEKYITAPYDGLIRIWDADKHRCLCTMPHNCVQNAVVCSDDGKCVFGLIDKEHSGGKRTYFVRQWDTETLRVVQEIPVGCDRPKAMSFHPDKKLLAVAAVYGYQVVCVESGQRIIHMDFDEGRYNEFISFSRDGRFLITAAKKDRGADIIFLDSNKVLYTLSGHKRPINCAVYSCDSRYIGTASSDHTARIWDANTFACLHILEGHNESVEFIRFSHNGKWAITASSDCTVRIWSVESGDCVGILDDSPKKMQKKRYGDYWIYDGRLYQPGHSAVIWTAEFSPDDQYVITTSNDGYVKIWDFNKRTCIKSIPLISGKTGVNIHGVQMKNLHPESKLDDIDKNLLSEYGVILE